MSTQETPLRNTLAPYYSQYRFWLVLRMLLDALALLAFGGAVLVAVDAVFSLHREARVLSLCILGTLLLITLFVRGVGFWKLDIASLAQRLDAAQGNGRNEILSALQMESQRSEGMSPVLVQATVAQGVKRLSEVPASAVFPRGLLLPALRRLGLVLILLVGFQVVYPQVAEQVVPRYLDPWGDHPPYSPLDFRVEASLASVPYGDPVEVKGKVAGQPGGEVYLMIETPGETRRVQCFVSSDETRSQRIESVTAPIAFWFETTNPWGFGRARSKRHKIGVLHTPKFTLLSVTIRPPAYTRAAPTTVIAASEPLPVPKGGTADVQVVSNRPLKEARLSFRVGADDTSLAPLRTPCDGAKSVSISIPVEQTTKAEIQLVDIEGNTSRQTRTLHFLAVDDQRPVVSIEQPDKRIFATPEATVRIAARAEDDYGLRGIRFVRTLKGYRDRARQMPVAPVLARMQTIEYSFPLASLGVRPGETIEYFAEAHDNNPVAPGYSSSDVQTIHIISTKNYMRMMRGRRTLRQFQKRVREVPAAIQEMLDEMKKAKETLADPKATAAQKKAARQRLQEMMGKTRRTLSKRIQQPALYDVERLMKDDWRKVLKKLERAGLDKDKNDQEILEMLAELEGEFVDLASTVREKAERAEMLKEVAELLQRANQYQALTRLQRDLARRMRSLADRENLETETARKDLLRRQKTLREKLTLLRKQIGENLEAIPDTGFEELQESTQKFLDAFDQLEVAQAMQEAEDAKESSKTAEAAARAATLMESLIAQTRGMPGQAGKGTLRFNPSDTEITGSNTQQMLAQLLESLDPSGLSDGSGSGQGGGGSSTSSLNALNASLYGPLDGAGGGAEGTGKGDGSGQGGTRKKADVKNADFKRTTHEKAARERMALELFPEAYRDELNAYFERQNLPETEE